MRTLLSRLFIVVFLFVLSQSAQAFDKGLLWKLEAPSGKVSYLLGTIHTDDQRVTEFSPKVIEAFNQTDGNFAATRPFDFHAQARRHR
jgi:uncharacterized protein